MIVPVLLILFARGPPPVGDTRGSLVSQTLMPAGPGFNAGPRHSASERAMQGWEVAVFSTQPPAQRMEMGVAEYKSAQKSAHSQIPHFDLFMT